MSAAPDPSGAKPRLPAADLRGKVGLVLGIANEHSIAAGCAARFAESGARFAATYLNDKAKPYAEAVTGALPCDLLLPCDLREAGALERVFDAVREKYGRLDFLLHSIAYAPRDDLHGRVADCSAAGFAQAMDISCYSFVAVAQRAAALMHDGGSMLTMTYYGAEKVMPHYNVMGVAKAALEASVRYLAADFGGVGIRVNGISAGPVRTLAASGIGDFTHILKWNQYNSPLARNVTLEEVGGAGLYLLSGLSGGVTGEIHHVDCGYHVVGMKNPAAPDIAAVD